MTHPALQAGNTALITGGASGIGLAAARRFAGMGLNVVLVDLGSDRLEAAVRTLIHDGAVDSHIRAIEADVGNAEAMTGLAKTVREVDVLMNNAAIGPGSSVLDPANWQKVLGANLWGVVYGTQAFVPHMVARGKPGLVINTGSKQGITTPPGDPAYNVSKSAVKVFTEALQHELRTCSNPAVTAHLLIPGFVWTGMTARGQTEKPAGAWTAEQTVDFMIEGIVRGDFYILCPDNDVPRALDEKRMAWAIGDIIENRPPLSRWHPDHAEAFRAFLTKDN
jgi:NAD(P)-dependent dehydrogenase (short-subunit alcohol dehydrogenase family)